MGPGAKEGSAVIQASVQTVLPHEPYDPLDKMVSEISVQLDMHCRAVGIHHRKITGS